MEIDCPTRWPSAYNMLDRAIYLQPAINSFIDNHPEHQDLKLTPIEWEQAKFLRDLLHPFKACNDRIEATSRPGIDKVFPTYEVLFNELDRLSEVLEDPTHDDYKWMNAIYPAIIEMKLKLKRYYGKTEHPSVYGNCIILNPKWKLALFRQDSWEEGSVDKYRDQCCRAYMEDYHTYDVQPTRTSFSIGMKRPWESIDEEEDSDIEYENLRKAAPSPEEATFNEYDHYVGLPVLTRKMRTLDYWRAESTSLPKLALMARDYLAVSATGAGVEGHFSRSGQVMRPSRRSLHARTVSNIMIYTDHCKRLKKEVKRWKGAGMTLGDDVILENTESVTGDQVPQEWRDQWWKERGHRFSSRRGR